MGFVGLGLRAVLGRWWAVYGLLIPPFVLGCFLPLDSTSRQHLMMLPVDIACGIPLVLIIKSALCSGSGLPSGDYSGCEITYKGW